MGDLIIASCIYGIFRVIALYCEKELKIKDPLLYFVLGAIAALVSVIFIVSH